jgi:hypothetical protein
MLIILFSEMLKFSKVVWKKKNNFRNFKQPFLKISTFLRTLNNIQEHFYLFVKMKNLKTYLLFDKHVSKLA